MVRVLLVILLLAGCSTHFNRTVVIDNLTVHISDDCGEGYIGWALPDEICIKGQMIDGKIDIDFMSAGHELTHVLNKKDRDIRNPE